MKHFILAAAMLAAPAAAQTQMEMNARADREWKTADAVMTVQWKRTFAYMRGLDAKDTSRGGGVGYAGALLQSQRAWLKFRDSECVIDGSEFAGGSMQPMARAGCLARLTQGRTVQLRKLEWRR